jgi:hypothetical protein
MTITLQWLETAQSSDDADAILAFMASQDGFINGRIIEPTDSKPTWRIQSFHDATGVTATTPLPDGCRLVTCPSSLLRR